MNIVFLVALHSHFFFDDICDDVIILQCYARNLKNRSFL